MHEDTKNKLDEMQNKLINTEQLMTNKINLIESENLNIIKDKDKEISSLKNEVKKIQIENASLVEVQISENKNNMAKKQLEDYRKFEVELKKKLNDE